MLFDRKKSEQIAQDLLEMKFKMGGRGLPAEAEALGGLPAEASAQAGESSPSPLAASPEGPLAQRGGEGGASGSEEPMARRGEGAKASGPVGPPARREIDCYGLLCLYYEQFGIRLPDYSYLDDWDEKEEHYLKEYSSFFRKLDPNEIPETGDMILFLNVPGAANHAGLYLGESRFVHANRKIGVKIDSLTNPVWKKKVYGFFRIKD